MPRKIKDTNENRNKAIEIIRLIAIEGLTYEQIASKWNTGKDYIYNLIKSQKSNLGISWVITKYDYYKITGEMRKMVELYESKKETTVSLAAKYNVSDHTMANYLRKEGVQIRDSGFESVVPQNIFSVIDSEIKAYTLGLLTADGSIDKANRRVTLTLTKNDGYLLEKINALLLQGGGKISITRKEDAKPRVQLAFCGKQICADLNKHGIIWNKTHTLDKLDNTIPNHLYHHYLRGLYDGDGVCAYQTSHKQRTVRVGFCNYNKSIVEEYRNFFHDELGLKQNKLFNTGNCWQCSWSSKSDLKNFYNYIYQDATVFLDRKWKKLSNYVNTEVN